MPLLKDGGEDVQNPAAAVLKNFVHNSEERRFQIVKAGALPPLIALLKDGHLEDSKL